VISFSVRIFILFSPNRPGVINYTVFYFHIDRLIAIEKPIKNYLFKNLSNTAILIVLYLSKHLHICVIFNILYFKINRLVSCLIGGIWQDLGPRLFPVFYVGSYYSITFLRFRRKLGQGHLMSTMRGRFRTGSSLSLPG
jgi:branched-subunit amino acid permease